MSIQTEKSFRVNSLGLACVDLRRWPIDRPESPEYEILITDIRGAIKREGCARLDSFVHRDFHSALEAEVNSIAHTAHYSNGAITPYFNKDEPDFPSSHPRRRFSEFSNGFVAMDRFPAQGICLSLYFEEHFQRFIADCLDEKKIFTFDDPLAGVVANVMPEGAALAWHYDTNEFIVSLLTRKPDSGGAFEFCPNLRIPSDERYEEVERILDGSREGVRTLYLELGDLQIFKGRFSMHRVVPCKGERHTAIFGYAKEPGFIGKVQRTIQVHGRVLQAHIDAESAQRTDGLDD